MRYFLYARKSTDVDDKQILSIEAQLSELRTLAKREGLEIATEFTDNISLSYAFYCSNSFYILTEL